MLKLNHKSIIIIDIIFKFDLQNGGRGAKRHLSESESEDTQQRPSKIRKTSNRGEGIDDSQDSDCDKKSPPQQKPQHMAAHNYWVKIYLVFFKN